MMPEETQLDEVWGRALGSIKTRVSPLAFNTWFKNTSPVAIHEGFFVVSTPNRFTKEWIETRHLGLIETALNDASGSQMGVKIVVRKDTGQDPQASALTINPSDVVSAPGRTSPATHDQKLGRGSQRRGADQFNPRYTFDTFVVGEGNRFAHAAGLAVAENPASAYNPLFLYGGAGLGKTHLLHAIGHLAMSCHPESKVRYVTSERFTNEFINSIRDEQVLGFQRRYRSTDVLLIDDIQFIIDKERTQEEFFHTFNTLYEAHKQIVISSDRPPKDMPTLEDRLRSRFEWGLIVDISPPDLETRIAILRKKSEYSNINVPSDVINFIAGKIQFNVRELEGALTRLAAFAALTNSEIDMLLAKDVLKEVLPQTKPKEISIKLIQAEVARYYGISTAELTGADRSRFIAYPRQVCMFLSRDLTSLSLPKIGELFGGRDHTTVMHAVSKIESMIKTDKEAYNQVQELTSRIKLKNS